MGNKVLIFCRVSTEIQQTESQEVVLRQYAISRGYDPDSIDVYMVKESALSDIGSSDLRDYQIELLRRLEGGDYGTLVVHELSRVARSIIETIKIIDVLKKLHIQLLVYTGGMQMYIDDYTQVRPISPQENPAFELQVFLLASMAQSEMRHKKERMKRGKMYHQSQGGYIGGRVDYGYKTVQVGNRKMIDIDEVQADNVRMIYDMCIEGYSIAEITDKMIPHNITFAHITKILKNQAYTGEVKTTKSNYKKKLPSIITPQQYEQAQLSLQSRYIPRKGNIYMGTGIIKCHRCGSNINATRGISYACATYIGGYATSKKSQLTKSCDNHITVTIDIIDSILIKLSLDNERLIALQDKEKSIEDKTRGIREREQEITLCEDNISLLTAKQKDMVAKMQGMSAIKMEATIVYLDKIEEDISTNRAKIRELTATISKLQSDIYDLSSMGESNLIANIMTLMYEEATQRYDYDWIDNNISTISDTIRRHISRIEIHPTRYPMQITTNRPRYRNNQDTYIGDDGKIYKVVDGRELRVWYKGIDNPISYYYPLRPNNGHTMAIYTIMDDMRQPYSNMSVSNAGTAITMSERVVKTFSYDGVTYRVIDVPIIRRHNRVRDREDEKARNRMATAEKYTYTPLSAEAKKIIETVLSMYADDMSINDIMDVTQMSRDKIDRLGLSVVRTRGMKKYYSKKGLYKCLTEGNIRLIYKGVHNRPQWYYDIVSE